MLIRDPAHSASVTLKMRSRSLKSNHFFPPIPMKYLC